MFQNLLFDLDGTLTNSAEGITKCVQYALRAQNIEEPDLKKLEVFIGPPLRDSFIKYYGMTREQAEIGVENIVNATPISVSGRTRFIPVSWNYWLTCSRMAAASAWLPPSRRFLR